MRRIKDIVITRLTGRIPIGGGGLLEGMQRAQLYVI